MVFIKTIAKGIFKGHQPNKNCPWILLGRITTIFGCILEIQTLRILDPAPNILFSCDSNGEKVRLWRLLNGIIVANKKQKVDEEYSQAPYQQAFRPPYYLSWPRRHDVVNTMRTKWAIKNTCKRIYCRVKVISQVARTGCFHIFIATAPKVRLPIRELNIKVLNPIRYGTISAGEELSNVYFGVSKQVVSLLLSHETLKILW